MQPHQAPDGASERIERMSARRQNPDTAKNFPGLSPCGSTDPVSRTIGAKHSSGSDTVSANFASPFGGKGTVRVRAASEATPAESWQTIRARRSGEGLKPREGMIRPLVRITTLATPSFRGSMVTCPRSIVHVTTDDGNPEITWFATFPFSVDAKIGRPPQRAVP
jgi:hypothetical protein